MKSELSIEIDRPIDEVFEVTNEHVTEWSQTCVSEEILAETPDGVGTTFRMVTREGEREMVFDGVVTRYDEPQHSAVELTGRFFDIDVEYTFEDLNGRTRVTQRSYVKGKGLTRVMFLLFGWALKRSGCEALQNELQSLKRMCETRAAPTAT